MPARPRRVPVFVCGFDAEALACASGGFTQLSVRPNRLGGHSMRLGLVTGYSGPRMQSTIDLILEAERLGLIRYGRVRLTVRT